jgi:hypothetical protein
LLSGTKMTLLFQSMFLTAKMRVANKSCPFHRMTRIVYVSLAQSMASPLRLQNCHLTVPDAVTAQRKNPPASRAVPAATLQLSPRAASGMDSEVSALHAPFATEAKASEACVVTWDHVINPPVLAGSTAPTAVTRPSALVAGGEPAVIVVANGSAQ